MTDSYSSSKLVCELDKFLIIGTTTNITSRSDQIYDLIYQRKIID